MVELSNLIVKLVKIGRIVKRNRLNQTVQDSYQIW